MYKFSHDSLPDNFRKYFVRIINTHNHNTRASVNNYFVPRKNCSKGQNGLNYLGPRLWSGIPDNVKEKHSLTSFTSSLRKFWLKNIILLIESFCYKLTKVYVKLYFIFIFVSSYFIKCLTFLLGLPYEPTSLFSFN